MNEKNIVEDGSTVAVEYEGYLEDGTVFDSSVNHGQPLTFKVGENQVISGFEEGVKGMAVNESKDIVIKPEDGYGDYNQSLVQNVPRDKLPEEITLESNLMINLPNGAAMPVKIVEITSEFVKLDLNHPLAGKTLKFKLKVISIT